MGPGRRETACAKAGIVAARSFPWLSCSEVVEIRAVNAAQTVLVIDEALGEPAPWAVQLSRLFSVVTTASLAGAAVLGDRLHIGVVILVLRAPHDRARTLITALRRHPRFEEVPVFVMSPEAPLVSAELVGLTEVDVVNPAEAHYDFSLQVSSAASRRSSRPAPRRPSSASAVRVSDFRSVLPPVFDSPQRLLGRFAHECGEHGQRGLQLCERLSSRDSSSHDRRRAAEELRSLLELMRADALVFQQGELSQLLGLAEQVVARLNTTTQLVVPRGVVGLLSAFAELGPNDAGFSGFDAELHRIRLQSALGR